MATAVDLVRGDRERVELGRMEEGAAEVRSPATGKSGGGVRSGFRWAGDRVALRDLDFVG
jgi:hypothetical protein